MMDHGGHLVVGADSSGVVVPPGVDQRQAQLLDEASLRKKLQKYIDEPFEIATGVHEINGVPVALIDVQPHPHGCCVFRASGQYQDPKDPKKMKVAFRQGDMFTRHGSSSELISGQDLSRIMAKGQANGPERPSLAQDDQAFEAAVERAFEDKAHIPLVKFLDSAVEQVDRCLASGDDGALLELLDRLTCMAALAVRYGEDGWVQQVLARFVAVYERGFGRAARSLPGGPPRLWSDIAFRILALGALVMESDRPELVPSLALLVPSERAFGKHRHTNLMDHAHLSAVQSRQLTAQVSGRDADMAFIRAAALAMAGVSCINKRAPEHDQLMASMAQYDVLAAVAVWGQLQGESDAPYTPAYGALSHDRYEPALIRLARDETLRRTLFPGSDDELRTVLRILEKQARAYGGHFGGGDRYVDHEVVRFVDDMP